MINFESAVNEFLVLCRIEKINYETFKTIFSTC